MTLIFDTLNLTNLVKSDPCYTNNHKSTIDLFLTNKLRSLQFTSVTETGLCDYLGLIITFMKSNFWRLKPKNKFIKNPSEINEKIYKKQRNKCVSIRKKSIKQYFSNITSEGIVTNREF